MSILGSSCYGRMAGPSLVLPCHLLVMVTSAVGAHRAAHAGSPWGHRPVFLKFFPTPFLLAIRKGHFPAIAVQCCLPFLHKAKALYFLFHLVLVRVLVQCSFSFILYSSFTWTFPCTKPWPLTFPLGSATSSWSLSLALPRSWDRIHDWCFHPCYIGRRQPLYWGLASTQWSSARPAA